MSKKDIAKLLVGFAVVGSAIGFILAYFKKYKDFSAAVNADTDEFEDDLDFFEDESGDSGLASFSDSGRTYININ